MEAEAEAAKRRAAREERERVRREAARKQQHEIAREKSLKHFYEEAMRRRKRKFERALRAKQLRVRHPHLCGGPPVELHAGIPCHLFRRAHEVEPPLHLPRWTGGRTTPRRPRPTVAPRRADVGELGRAASATGPTTRRARCGLAGGLHSAAPTVRARAVPGLARGCGLLG